MNHIANPISEAQGFVADYNEDDGTKSFADITWFGLTDEIDRAARIMRALLIRIEANEALYRTRTASFDQALEQIDTLKASIPGQLSFIEAEPSPECDLCCEPLSVCRCDDCVDCGVDIDKCTCDTDETES